MKALIIAFFYSSLVFAKGEVSFLPQTFSSDFEQIQISSLSGKEKKSQGHVDYKYPGHIRFEVQKPDVIVFVSNPEKTWYYTAPFVAGEAGELTVKPTGKLALSKFFDALKKGLESNELYTVKESGLSLELTFSKKSAKELGLSKAMLNFEIKKDFSSLKGIDLFKNDQSKVTLKFSSMKLNVTQGKDVFNFNPPPHTRIAQ